MKMKEICERTGLTERAVRLYCERGLIAPQTYTQNDRDYLVFSEHDEQALCCIAILREADFSLEQIRTMQNEPFLIEKTVREHTARLMRESAEKLQVCQRLQALEVDRLHDIVDLARELKGNEPHSNVSPLKGPTFAEFCEQGGYCEDEALFFEEERLVRRGRIFSCLYVGYGVITAFISAAVNLTRGDPLGFLLTLGLNILFLVFFFRGYTWARVLLAVLAGIGLLVSLHTLFFSDYPLAMLFLFIPMLVLDVVCFYFLAFDKGVSAYQYDKRTGGDSYL